MAQPLDAPPSDSYLASFPDSFVASFFNPSHWQQSSSSDSQLNTDLDPHLWGPMQYEGRAVDATLTSQTQPVIEHTQRHSHPVMSTADESSPSASIASKAIHRHICPHRHCRNTYLNKGDLTRHITGVHESPCSFLCHIDRCPRGIPGQGFGRKDKLIDHLKSRKHGLSAKDAAYEAALHNTSRR